MQTPENFWTARAAGYAKSPIADMDAYTYTLERTRSYLAATDRVLEIGCGTGSTALLLAPGVKEYVASDFSGGMIDIAREKQSETSVDGLEFVVSDVFGANLGDAPYDAVLAFNLLHLVVDIPKALAAIHARLKPEGTFISKSFCVPTTRAENNFKFRVMKVILPLMQKFGQAPFVQFMTIAELEKMVIEAGFKIIETGNYPARPPNRYIVAKKI